LSLGVAMILKLMKVSADDRQFFPFPAMERGCRRSLTRWLADDRPPSAGKPAAIRPRSRLAPAEHGGLTCR